MRRVLTAVFALGISFTNAVAQQPLTTPVYSEYNTFLDTVNIIELASAGSAPVDAVLSVFDNSGALVTSRRLRIEPGEQFDVIVNDLINNQRDRYGVVRVDYNATEPGVELVGQTSYYRENQNGGFSFAFSRPLQNAASGRTAVVSNSMDPTGRGLPTVNWLQLTNVGDQTETFTVNRFDQNGALVHTDQLLLNPLERRDLQAGHENGQAIFLNEVLPSSSASRYLAAVSRYGAARPVPAAQAAAASLGGTGSSAAGAANASGLSGNRTAFVSSTAGSGSGTGTLGTGTLGTGTLGTGNTTATGTQSTGTQSTGTQTTGTQTTGTQTTGTQTTGTQTTGNAAVANGQTSTETLAVQSTTQSGAAFNVGQSTLSGAGIGSSTGTLGNGRVSDQRTSFGSAAIQTVVDDIPFAFAVDAQSGTSEPLFAVLSNRTADCAVQNGFLEVANASAAETNANVNFFDQNGTLLRTSPVLLPGRGQVHFLGNSILPAENDGLVQVTSADGTPLIVQSTGFAQNCVDNTLDSGFVVPGNTARNSTITGSFNRFLNTQNDLLVLNPTDANRSVDLSLGSRTTNFATSLPVLNARSVRRVNLNDTNVFPTQADTLGTVRLESFGPGGLLAVNLRRRSGVGGAVDFINPTAFR